ncbi:MAG: hypothetical protein RMK18_05635 [Armatimonadota bacterium]|nr:hypothetical protein [Armatimonadota bacterium]MCX7777780.1 hypothetical protein [Armatimonadota bacterium]MDW8025333.1 hypothetical protein [Armatimonadota bacterium]
MRDRQFMENLAHFWPAFGIALATFGLIVALMAGIAPLGVPGEWQWMLKRLNSGYKILYPFCPILLLGIFGFVAIKRVCISHNGFPKSSQILPAILAFSLTVCIMYMHPDGPSQVTSLILNPASNSYYQTAVEYQDILNLLADYHEKMPWLISHAKTQAPGPVILHWLFHKIFAHSSFAMDVADVALFIGSGINCHIAANLFQNFWGGWIQPENVAVAFWISLTLCAMGSLAVIPLYHFVRRIVGIEAAIGSVILFPVIPSFSLFAPSVDQLYPAVTLAVFCLAEAAIDSLLDRRTASASMWSAFVGLVLGIGIFCNMGLVVILLLVTLYVWFRIIAAHENFSKKFRNFSAFFCCMLGAMLLLFLLFWLLFRFNLLATFLVSDAFRSELYAGPPARTYWKWLLWSPIDFFLFSGLPLVWLFTEGIVKDFIRLKRSRKVEPLHCFSAAFLLTFIALDLSGKVRGESGRMWMFLMPCLIPHATWCLQSHKWCEFRHRLLVVFLLQAIIVVALREYVLVWGY